MSENKQKDPNDIPKSILNRMNNAIAILATFSILLALIAFLYLESELDRINTLQGQITTMRQEATAIMAGHAQRISDLEEIVELQGAQLNSLDPSIELENPLGIEQSNMDPNSTPGESSDKSYPLVEHFMGLR